MIGSVLEKRDTSPYHGPLISKAVSSLALKPPSRQLCSSNLHSKLTSLPFKVKPTVSYNHNVYPFEDYINSPLLLLDNLASRLPTYSPLSFSNKSNQQYV